MNHANLTGRLTKDVELKYMENGTAVANGTIATNRPFTNQNGERESDFINFVIWRKAAENFSNFTSKGSLVGLEGRIQTRNYDNQQGQRIYVTELVVENFDLLESKADSDARKLAQSREETPAMPTVAQDVPTAEQIGIEDVLLEDDNLPF